MSSQVVVMAFNMCGQEQSGQKTLDDTALAEICQVSRKLKLDVAVAIRVHVYAEGRALFVRVRVQMYTCRRSDVCVQSCLP